MISEQAFFRILVFFGTITYFVLAVQIFRKPAYHYIYSTLEDCGLDSDLYYIANIVLHNPLFLILSHENKVVSRGIRKTSERIAYKRRRKFQEEQIKVIAKKIASSLSNSNEERESIFKTLFEKWQISLDSFKGDLSRSEDVLIELMIELMNIKQCRRNRNSAACWFVAQDLVLSYFPVEIELTEADKAHLSKASRSYNENVALALSLLFGYYNKKIDRAMNHGGESADVDMAVNKLEEEHVKYVKRIISREFISKMRNKTSFMLAVRNGSIDLVIEILQS